MDLTNVLLSVIAIELAALTFLTWKKTTSEACPPDHQHQQGVTLTNYCRWKHEHGKWRVVEDRCLPGFQCGDPPARLPDYPNENVRKPATRITV